MRVWSVEQGKHRLNYSRCWGFYINKHYREEAGFWLAVDKEEIVSILPAHNPAEREIRGRSHRMHFSSPTHCISFVFQRKRAGRVCVTVTLVFFPKPKKIFNFHLQHSSSLSGPKAVDQSKELGGGAIFYLLYKVGMTTALLTIISWRRRSSVALSEYFEFYDVSSSALS